MNLNFKDVYKSSNDCIKADRNLMEDIFKKSEKPVWFNYGRLAISCAAVVVCIAVGSLFVKQSSPTVPGKKPVYNEPVKSGETVVMQADSEKVRLGIAVDDTKNAANKSVDNTPSETLQTEVPDVESDIKAEPETFLLPKMASGGSGAGGTMYDSVSLDEYANYIGIDIFNISPKLPDGMYMVLPSEITFEKNSQTGDITGDHVQFIALDSNNPNRIIMTELTKSEGEISSLFTANTNSMVTVDNVEVVVISEENTIKSCFKHNDLWVLITSIDVSKEEFDAFLNSLIKKEN